MLPYSIMWRMTWINSGRLEAFTPPWKPRFSARNCSQCPSKQNDQSVGLVAANLGLDYWSISLRWFMMVDDGFQPSWLRGSNCCFLGCSICLDPHLVLGHGWCWSWTGIIFHNWSNSINNWHGPLDRLPSTNSERVLLNMTNRPLIKHHQTFWIITNQLITHQFNQYWSTMINREKHYIVPAMNVLTMIKIDQPSLTITTHC